MGFSMKAGVVDILLTKLYRLNEKVLTLKEKVLEIVLVESIILK